MPRVKATAEQIQKGKLKANTGKGESLLKILLQ